jgi:type IV secretion system protein VirB3
MSNIDVLQVAPVFKGCTRPPMLWGVPMLPMVALGIAGFLIIMYSLVLGYPIVSLVAIAFFIPTFIYMRIISKSDEYQLEQSVKRFVIRFYQRTETVTFTPTKYKKR